jgi:RimJ/RimL family protein N-acetyltransferase
MRTLLTDRLRLVPVTAQNAETLWRMLQQGGLREYQDLPDVDLMHFRRMVAARPVALEPGAWGRFEWMTYIEGVAEPAGWTSLRVGERVSGCGEVGYSVVEPYRGRGIATESVRAIVSEAFARLRLRKIRAFCVPENTASRAVLIHAGFEEDGVLPHGATVQGRPVDVIGYVLDRANWELRKPA